MPILSHAAFLDRLKGKSINLIELHSAYPDLSIRGIAGDGIIEGTVLNLEKLWEAIDRYDHDGNVNTISDSARIVDREMAICRNRKSGAGEWQGGKLAKDCGTRR